MKQKKGLQRKNILTLSSTTPSSGRGGFTLIELLVVIAIIGVLAGIVLASLGTARKKAQVAAIQSSLKNFQTAAALYLLDHDTFAGLCNYSDNTVDASVQALVDSLKAIAGNDKVKCIVRTSDVPYTPQYVAADGLEQKNFGLAVYYDERHYAVDMQGVMTLDTTNSGGTANWDTANQRCADAGKRLPSIEVFKAINDYGAQGGNLSFLASGYWSSTEASSSPGVAYRQRFSNGNVDRLATTISRHVRCAS